MGLRSLVDALDDWGNRWGDRAERALTRRHAGALPTRAARWRWFIGGLVALALYARGWWWLIDYMHWDAFNPGGGRYTGYTVVVVMSFSIGYSVLWIRRYPGDDTETPFERGFGRDDEAR